MLTSLEVHKGSSVLELSLVSNEISSAPIQIRNIEGIGPVNASVNTTPYGSIDGESYSGSTVGKRNIVLTLGLNPNWVDQSVESLRQMLYAYFMPKKSITIHFFSTHLPEIIIAGYVESATPNIFSKDPEMQISIICPNPDFVSVDPTVFTGATISTPALSFIDYEGTVPTGFVLKVESSVLLPTYEDSVGISVEADTLMNFGVNRVLIDSTQYLEMSSVQGQKYIRTVDLSNVITSLMGEIGDSDWPHLDHGMNGFEVTTDIEGLDWTLTYYERFGGI